MINDFFEHILVPDFLKPYFNEPEWYLVILKLKEILEKEIPETKLLSSAKNLTINGKAYIGKNCVISENVVIDGPVYIDDNVEIGPGVYLRPGTVISKGCAVGHASEVKNSVMMEGSKTANHVFLGDSIIGAKARLGGHCETANRRFDQSEIEFIYKEQKLFTGKDKLGVILGEGSRLGGGVFTSPGSMIGKGTFVYTTTQVSGYIPPHKYVKADIPVKILENKFEGELKPSSLFERPL